MTGVTVIHGDSADVIKTLSDCSIDSVVCDPPYALVSITKRFAAASQTDDTKTSDRTRRGADGYARLSKGFMGKAWDNGAVAFSAEFWVEVLRVLKPGGHLVAFGGTRTYHRLACAIEDAGFEIRDQIGWVYGSGFPKSHDVSKAIDKNLGHERLKVRVDSSQVRNPKATGGGKDGAEGATRPWIEAALERGFHEAVSNEAVSWEGWGTALKPAWEPIVLARKPLIGTVAANVLKHGTGSLNIDATRIGYASDDDKAAAAAAEQRSCQTAPRSFDGWGMRQQDLTASDYIAGAAGNGRWPANIIQDGSAEVLRAFPDSDGQSGAVNGSEPSSKTNNVYGSFDGRPASAPRGDLGSAARFFYSAKADSGDRLNSKHPTVKPVDLMAYLCRLITPPGGIVLDPFAGSGTTGMACLRESFNCVLIEREAEYVADIRARIAHVRGDDTPLFSMPPPPPADPLDIPAFLRRVVT